MRKVLLLVEGSTEERFVKVFVKPGEIARAFEIECIEHRSLLSLCFGQRSTASHCQINAFAVN